MPEDPLPALPSGKGERRDRADHDRGLGGPPAEDARRRSATCTPTRTRSCRGCGRSPRTAAGMGLCCDDPAHPSRAAHGLEPGRVAAGAGAVADPRTGAPCLSEGGRGLGPGADRRPICGGGAADAGGRARRDSSSRPTGICSTSSGPRPPTGATTSMAAASTTRLRFCLRVLDAVRAGRRPPDFIARLRLVADEDWGKGL